MIECAHMFMDSNGDKRNSCSSLEEDVLKCKNHSCARWNIEHENEPKIHNNDKLVHKGVISEFCRKKGYGYIHAQLEDNKEIFFHISDLQTNFVPKTGDKVRFKTILAPPKFEKLQAIDIKLVDFHGSHETWQS